MKWRCNRCGEEKPQRAFEWRSDVKLWRKTCRECRVGARAQRPRPERQTCVRCGKDRSIHKFTIRDGRPRAYCWDCEWRAKKATITPEKREIIRANALAHYYRNREKLCAAVKEYKRLPESRHKQSALRRTPRYRKMHADYYREHRVEIAAATRKRLQRRPGLVSVAQMRRIMREEAVENTLTTQEWEQILETHDHRCAYCLRKAERLEIDHVVAVSRGGGTTAENVVPACRSCNAKKGARPVFMMATYI